MSGLDAILDGAAWAGDSVTQGVIDLQASPARTSAPSVSNRWGSGYSSGWFRAPGAASSFDALSWAPSASSVRAAAPARAAMPAAPSFLGASTVTNATSPGVLDGALSWLDTLSARGLPYVAELNRHSESLRALDVQREYLARLNQGTTAALSWPTRSGSGVGALSLPNIGSSLGGLGAYVPVLVVLVVVVMLLRTLSR